MLEGTRACTSHPASLHPQVLEDISSDHALKTVTLEAHPHTSHGAGLHASIHPCKHASVMHKLCSEIASSGREVRAGRRAVGPKGASCLECLLHPTPSLLPKSCLLPPPCFLHPTSHLLHLASHLRHLHLLRRTSYTLRLTGARRAVPLPLPQVHLVRHPPDPAPPLLTRPTPIATPPLLKHTRNPATPLARACTSTWTRACNSTLTLRCVIPTVEYDHTISVDGL